MRHSKLIIFSKSKYNNNFNNNCDIFKNLSNQSDCSTNTNQLVFDSIDI